MLEKWFEKKAHKLGYMKLSDFEKYKQEMFNEVKNIAIIRDNFNPRIKAIEKRNKEIFESNIALNGRIDRFQNDLKRLTPLSNAVARLREDIDQIAEIWKSLDELKSIIDKVKDEDDSLRKRLNQLARAKDTITKLEPLAESLTNLDEFQKSINKVAKDLEKSVEALTFSIKQNEKAIKKETERFNRARINGHPLNGSTHLTVKDFDISLINNIETRVKRDLKTFEKEIEKRMEEKLIPHSEKEKKLDELNKKVDDIVRVNSNVKTLRKQKTFDELYKQVVKDSKKKL